MINKAAPFDEHHEFENTVRRLARSLWPSAEHEGAQVIDGRESDGVFTTEDVIHLVECTVSRKKEKAEHDIRKLITLWKKMRSPSKPVKCWFITRDEPTGDQRTIGKELAKKNPGFTIEILSLDQFRAKLIDIARYIDCRKNYRFGSMQENPTHRDFSYVPFDIISSNNKLHQLDDITERLIQGMRIVILGDYGAGKSTTMRELFLRLSTPRFRDTSHQFPVLLNLRDHYGQTDATEALDRHAKKIGFESGTSLVRAWRAGYALIMLDGFDEIAIPGWQGQPDKLKKLRRDSMQLVRDFVKDTPSDRGIIISGRRNYFDGNHEMCDALGLSTSHNESIFLSIQDFTEEQVKQYLEKNGRGQAVPSWLPTRPLLLSYLITKKLIDSVLDTGIDLTPAEGWDALLTRICDREALLEVGIDGTMVRHLIERLASKARTKSDGLGPISADEILRTFQDVCHYVPDDRASILLQRLPGLGVPNDEDGARKFIDLSLADAARAGDAIRYITTPFEPQITYSDRWQAELGDIGLQMLTIKCAEQGLSPSQISLALREAVSRHESSVLASDIMRLAQEMDYGYRELSWVNIRDILIQELEFDNTTQDFSHIVFQDCIIRDLVLSPDVQYENLPRFRQCLIAKVDGRISEQEMPADVFTNCMFEEFANSGSTNNAVMELSIPLGCRVMIVTLRKLYVQSGAGRRTSSLYRGLDHGGRLLIKDILRILKQEELVIETKMGQNTVWLPVRSQTARVRALLSAPLASHDTIMDLARELAD